MLIDEVDFAYLRTMELVSCDKLRKAFFFQSLLTLSVHGQAKKYNETYFYSLRIVSLIGK